jgi:hypothetical protein
VSEQRRMMFSRSFRRKRESAAGAKSRMCACAGMRGKRQLLGFLTGRKPR